MATTSSASPDNMSSPQLKFIKTQKGNLKVSFCGNVYMLNRRIQHITYWKCIVKNCNARLVLRSDALVRASGEHTHPDYESAFYENGSLFGDFEMAFDSIISADTSPEGTICEENGREGTGSLHRHTCSRATGYATNLNPDAVRQFLINAGDRPPRYNDILPPSLARRSTFINRSRRKFREGLESSQDALPMLSHPVLPGSSQHEDIPRDIPLPTLKKIRTSTSNACESRPPLREVDHSNTPPPPILTQQTNLPPQMLCVRWGNYDSNMHSMFTKLLTKEHFVDVTLACEGRTIRCHKVVLSSCSTYFEQLLTENPCPHPIIFMKDLQFWEVQALVDFMYKGEVNVPQEKLPSLLKSAECLQVKGLGASGTDGNNDKPLETPTTSNEQPQIQNIQRSVSSPIATKRRRQEATNHETYRSTPTNSSTNRRSDGHKHQRITPQSSLPHGVTAFPHSKMSHVDIQSQMMIKMEPEEIDLQEDSVDSNHFKDEESIDKDPDRTNNDIEGNITSETTTEHRAQRRMNAEQHGEEPNRTQEHLNFGPELSMADLGKETQDDEDSDNDIESDQDIDTSSREPPDINRLKQDSEPH